MLGSPQVNPELPMLQWRFCEAAETQVAAWEMFRQVARFAHHPRDPVSVCDHNLIALRRRHPQPETSHPEYSGQLLEQFPNVGVMLPNLGASFPYGHSSHLCKWDFDSLSQQHEQAQCL